MNRTNLAYVIAGGVGLLAALYGAVGAPRIERTANAAAVVNGVPIPREALARAVLALASDSRNAVTPTREAEVLEHLIEEELLVQHGVELGLAETDFAARRAVVQSVLSLAVAARAGAEPDEAELRRFHRDNQGFFAPASRFSASVVFIRAGTGVAQRAEDARRSLASGASANGLGDAMTIPIPRSSLDQGEWRRLIGRDATNAVAALAPGEVSTPLPTAGGAYIIRLDGFVAAPPPLYANVAEQVRAEWNRRADETAARAYIAQLARAARIERRLDEQ
jgi:parvulin-like peptidyl-prolyl isomerase